MELSRFSTLEVAASGVEFAVGGDLGFALSNSDSGASSALTVTTAGGEILNSGLLRLPVQPFFDAVTVRSTGTVRVDGAGGAYLRDGSQIIIEETGTLLLTDAISQGNRYLYGNSFSDPGEARVTLRGRIVEEGNGVSDGIYVPVDVLGGEITVRSGRLDVRAGGTLQNPTLNGEQGAELQLFGAWDIEGTVSGQSAASPGQFEDDIAVVFAGSSSGPPTTFRALGEVIFDVDGSGIELGVSTATTVLTAAPGGRFINRSPILQKGVVVLRAVELRNEDEVSGGGFRFEEGARFVNAAGATATLRNGVVAADGTGAFVNEGLVQTNQNGSNLTFRGILDSRPGSELRVRTQPGASGEALNLSQEDPARYGAGVTVSGTGGVLYAFGTRHQGTVSPGTPEAPFGTIGTSDLQFSETEGAPRFVVDVGADGASDVVNTADAGILNPGGATLVVRVAPGFTPTPGDEWTVARRFSNSAPPTGAFPVVEVEGAPAGITFVQDPEARGAIVVRAVAEGLAVAAREATVAEGASTAFVLTHPPSPAPYSVTVETAGTATRFSDYTLGAAGGRVRVAANTTQTSLPVFARRDAEAGEGAETVTLRLGGGADGEATLTITDGPSTTALAVERIAPARGSTAGQITATVYGTGFADGAAVRLVGPSTVEGARARLGESGALVATFDLRGAVAGTYGVEVTSGGTATLAGAFTVEDATPSPTPPVWGAITGTPNPRRGRWSTYTVTVGNDGPVDIYDTVYNLRIPGDLEFEVLDLDPVEGGQTGTEYLLDVNDNVVYPVYAYRLGAGGSTSFRVRVRPTRPNQRAGVAVQTHAPNPDALFTYSGDPDDLAADAAANRPTNWAMFQARFSSETAGRLGAYAAEQATLSGRNDPDACSVVPPSDPDAPTPEDLTNAYANGSDDGVPLDNLDAATRTHQINAQTNTKVTEINRDIYINKRRGSDKIHDMVRQLMMSRVSAGAFAAAVSSGESGPAGVPSDCGGGRALGSFDPNDKVGPSGVGAENHYRPDGQTFPYTIRFENLDTATAPAQEVVVTDSLDTAVFDLDTFRFGAITFGEAGRIVPPADVTSFEATVDLSDPALGGLDATLLVTGALDVESGVVTWRFATLDPETGDLPEDALVGFLPPNVDGTGEGEGAVMFTVETVEGLPSGTVIANDARIVFDVNEPIDTPAWANTVDLTPPSTRVEPLAAQTDGPLQVTVSGGDGGAGVGTYALFVQRAGGPFELAELSAEPTFTFTPPEPGVYGFHARAIDAVGNVEPPKTEAEATTSVGVDAGGGPDVPAALTLSAPFPNPSRGRVVLRVGLPAAGPATVRVLDAIGREVAVLLDGEAGAGWRSVSWPGGVAPGVYTVEVRSADEVRRQRVTVVR